MPETLASRLAASFAKHAARPALHAGEQTLSYRELDRKAHAVAGALQACEIGPGHRVGIWMDKSFDAVAVLIGTLLAGATYVPIEPRIPGRRACTILSDCGVSGLAVDALREPMLESSYSELPTLRLVLREGALPGDSGSAIPQAPRIDSLPPPELTTEDHAYILYTSGSTGRPKGVVLSHRAALGFIDWCQRTFVLKPEDQSISHAPFNFDLSIFDLFVTFCAGASVRLLTATEGMLAPWLVRKLSEWGITVWYSVPSALIAMLEQGRLAEHGWPSARLVLFAGEVFPTPKLRQLRQALPHVRLVNLYGPTETNVCTYFEVGKLPEGETRPIPIGRVCEHLEGVILDEQMQEQPPGDEGDLWIGGANLLTGYWNDSELSSRRLKPDPRPGKHGVLYNTGDRVQIGTEGNLIFLGRRDHMVKVRGYRIELGEVEGALYAHPEIAEAAVVAVPDVEGVQHLVAFVCAKGTDGVDPQALRVHLKERLPIYMLPEHIVTLEQLPRTANGKVDRLRLNAQGAGEPTQSIPNGLPG